jgi:RNA polymerase sigma-70 factor, ECF subfamily
MTEDARSGEATLDEATLADLYRRHGGHLLGTLVRLTNGDRGKAEDILQETLVRAWRNPQAIGDNAVANRRWLFTVARRIAIDHFRRVAARPTEICDEAPESRIPACDPYDDVLEACDMEVVLAGLPAHHRDVLVELHMNDRSIAATARLLGVPVGTVKSRNHHAVRALRSRLDAMRMRTAV